jgi:hypothetical protein
VIEYSYAVHVLLSIVAVVYFSHLILQEKTDKMSTMAEQPCYTLINIPSDAEPPTEMQLRQDLGQCQGAHLIEKALNLVQREFTIPVFWKKTFQRIYLIWLDFFCLSNL